MEIAIGGAGDRIGDLSQLLFPSRRSLVQPLNRDWHGRVFGHQKLALEINSQVVVLDTWIRHPIPESYGNEQYYGKEKE
jgi:hypothetical protein